MLGDTGFARRGLRPVERREDIGPKGFRFSMNAGIVNPLSQHRSSSLVRCPSRIVTGKQHVCFVCAFEKRGVRCRVPKEIDDGVLLRLRRIGVVKKSLKEYAVAFCVFLELRIVGQPIKPSACVGQLFRNRLQLLEQKILNLSTDMVVGRFVERVQSGQFLGPCHFYEFDDCVVPGENIP